MHMKKSNITKWIVIALVALSAVFAIIHLATRTNVPEQTLLVEYQGKEISVNFAAMPLEQVKGTLVNGKGDRMDVDEMGCSLATVLEKALGDASAAQAVTAVAADEYSASVSSDEWNTPETVYLLQVDDSIQMVVFGDSNSKRNVRNVERLIVE